MGVGHCKINTVHPDSNTSNSGNEDMGVSITACVDMVGTLLKSQDLVTTVRLTSNPSSVKGTVEDTGGRRCIRQETTGSDRGRLWS